MVANNKRIRDKHEALVRSQMSVSRSQPNKFKILASSHEQTLSQAATKAKNPTTTKLGATTKVGETKFVVPIRSLLSTQRRAINERCVCVCCVRAHYLRRTPRTHTTHSQHPASPRRGLRGLE